MLNEIYIKYGLNADNIIATVTDNGSNFAKAFRKFGLSDSDLLLPGMVKVSQVSNNY